MHCLPTNLRLLALALCLRGGFPKYHFLVEHERQTALFRVREAIPNGQDDLERSYIRGHQVACPKSYRALIQKVS